MSNYVSTLTQPSGRQFIGYLTRVSDSFIYNSSTSQFEGTVLADLVGNERVPYRISYSEGAPGSYSATLDISQFEDGEYSLESREIANDVEYANISTDVFEVSAGAVSSTDILIKITTAPTRALFAYIESSSTGLFFNSIDNSMGRLDLLTASLDSRGKFRHSYSETRPSEYLLTIDASSLLDGVYLVRTYELVGDVEIEAGEDHLIRVQDGKQLAGVDFGSISLSENTGGKDSLKYVQANGVPVENAIITVYLSNEYNQGNTANPIGKTTTDFSGRWVDPISVDPGNTYTVVFQKSGHFGPDSKEVVV